MPEQEKQQLSRDVAEKYGIVPFITIFRNDDYDDFWLHNDSARCFDLMVEHGVSVNDKTSKVFANVDGLDFYEHYCDHPTKQEATRIAILKALLAKE